MKNILLLSLLSLSFILTSCSDTVDVVIDNPLERSIIIKMDTLTVEVPAQEVVWVEMGKGEHQITLENDSIINYNFTEKLYMLNPTLCEYLKTEEYYGSAAFENSYKSNISSKKVEFLGIEFEGNYDVIRGVVNPVSWDYGPRESLPEMVEVEENEHYTTLTKIYDPFEFINEIKARGGSDDETVTEE